MIGDSKIQIAGITETLNAFSQLEARVRKESLYKSTLAAMSPHVSVAKQAAISGLTTLDSRARRQMASSIGIKSKNLGKGGRKAISWSMVGPVLDREFTTKRKRRAGQNGQFDYAKMAHWFGGPNGVRPHIAGTKGGKHPGIKATPVWEPVFMRNRVAIISRFESRLSNELLSAVKSIGTKAEARIRRQERAFLRATGAL